jgi:hypothetical protein
VKKTPNFYPFNIQPLKIQSIYQQNSKKKKLYYHLSIIKFEKLSSTLKKVSKTDLEKTAPFQVFSKKAVLQRQGTFVILKLLNCWLK